MTGLGAAARPAAGDRRRLGEYLEDVREVERRIQRAEATSREDLTLPDVPPVCRRRSQEHLKLLMDLQVIAFQADITRVSTLMFARELSGAIYPETTIRDPFHNLSHHSNDRGNMDRFAQLNTYHMTKFAYFLEKLKATPDGEGTLLDHSMVLYGSSLSDGNQHNFSPLPSCWPAARRQLKGGRHLQFAKDTPCRTCCWRCWTSWAPPERSATAPACWKSDAAGAASPPFQPTGCSHLSARSGRHQ